MATDNAISLADCHPSVLQRILGLCDRGDLFLLRQVCRCLRAEADRMVRRVMPNTLSPDFQGRFSGVTTLDLSTCHSGSLQANLVQTATKLPNLRALAVQAHLDEDTAPSKWLEPLGRLTTLSLHGGFHDHGQSEALLLQMAGSCTSLQSLQLCNIYLPWSTLLQLITRLKTKLTALDISCPEITGQLPSRALEALSLDTGKLTTLRLTNEPFDWDGRQHEQGSNCLILTDAWAQLSAFTNLTTLQLKCNTELHDDGIDVLNALTQLSSLCLSGTSVTCAGLARLTALTRVIELHLSHMPLGYDPMYLEALDGFPCLNHLSIRAFGLVGDLQALTGLTRLVATAQCDLDYPAVLQSLSQLRDLRVEECIGGDFLSLRSLAALTQLTRLEFRMREDLEEGREFFGSRPEQLSWLQSLSQLQALIIPFGHSVVPECLKPLAALPALRELVLAKWLYLRRPRPTEGGVLHTNLQPLKSLPLEQLALPENLLWLANQLPSELCVALARGDRLHLAFERASALGRV